MLHPEPAAARAALKAVSTFYVLGTRSILLFPVIEGGFIFPHFTCWKAGVPVWGQTLNTKHSKLGEGDSFHKWGWRGAESCGKVPLSIGSRSWLGSGEGFPAAMSSPQCPGLIPFCCNKKADNGFLELKSREYSLLTHHQCPAGQGAAAFPEHFTNPSPGKRPKVSVPSSHREFVTGSKHDFPKWHCNA